VYRKQPTDPIKRPSLEIKFNGSRDAILSRLCVRIAKLSPLCKNLHPFHSLQCVFELTMTRRDLAFVLFLFALCCLTSRVSAQTGTIRFIPPRVPAAVEETVAEKVSDSSILTASEVDLTVKGALQAAGVPGYSVVVVDRAGRILAVWQQPGATLETAERALSLARTGAFFSNDQAPLSSRTVRFISGIHLPPGIRLQPNADLYGIENTNRGCDFNAQFNEGKFVPRAKSLLALLRDENPQLGPSLPCNAFDQSGCGVGISTGKYSGRFEEGRLIDIELDEKLDQKPLQVDGGGIPLFKDCRVAGGIGIFGIPPAQAEFAALVGSISGGPSFGPLSCLPPPGAVFLAGLRLPFIGPLAAQLLQSGKTTLPGTSPGTSVGAYLVLPRDGVVAADGWLVGGPDNPKNSTELSASEVQAIVQQAIDQANKTRAAIRLPPGSRTRMVIAVSDVRGNLLGLYRMTDATVFSIDVAVAKSRNVVYFSSERLDPRDLPGVTPGTAVTNRTISFGSQPLFPPGIDSTLHERGPFFDLFLRDLASPCSQGFDTENKENVNGIVFFPGSAPLFRNGKLIGGLGISGDGVDQDDVVTAAGTIGFEAPLSIRADQFLLRSVRLPYIKFNRNPEN
jgi:uncharacterized protein GlcG (DUF336 family)